MRKNLVKNGSLFCMVKDLDVVKILWSKLCLNSGKVIFDMAAMKSKKPTEQKKKKAKM